MTERVTRCSWAAGNELMADYHDREWGVPVRDDRELFAKLVLDGFQAGLSWAIILRKRADFLRAFDGFDPAKMARYGAPRVRRLLNDPGIVRNRLKVEAAVTNARAFQRYQKTGQFGAFLWDFVGGAPRQARRRTLRQIPAQSRESERMSRALSQLGFRFVGPTICYAFMQAVGMVNDHLVTCFRHRELGGS
ncbi:MAG: DNA-3-methyladenine glycosylase I [Gemmatimonadales bacterium]